MIVYKKTCSYAVLLLAMMPLMAREVILEFKGAYFLPTHCPFKKIYKGGALYGPELTVQLCEDDDWYAFASFDYYHKKGHSIGLGDPTRVKLIPLAFGLKYIVPSCDDYTDFYAGLGFQAVNVRTANCVQSVVTKLSQWGFGGIAKVGAYYYLPCDFLLDFFVDYSFVRVGSKHSLCPDSGTQSVKSNISGAIFGVGLGYSF